MKQPTLADAQQQAIASAIQRQKAIALHYANLDLQELEAEAIGKLQAKDNLTSDFTEDPNT